MKKIKSTKENNKRKINMGTYAVARYLKCFIPHMHALSEREKNKLVYRNHSNQQCFSTEKKPLTPLWS